MTPMQRHKLFDWPEVTSKRYYEYRKHRTMAGSRYTGWHNYYLLRILWKKVRQMCFECPFHCGSNTSVSFPICRKYECLRIWDLLVDLSSICRVISLDLVKRLTEQWRDGGTRVLWSVNDIYQFCFLVTIKILIKHPCFWK
jgi:hypothetical protein